MANIHVATDDIGSPSHDKQVLDEFVEAVRAAGHQVTPAGRGDSAIQNHMLKSSNKCDIMVQIAGGQCPSTFGDFNWGTRPGGYYHADKFFIPIETSVWTNYAKYDPKKYVLPARAWDDGFGQGRIDTSKIKGRTWQQVCNDKETFPRCAGFAEGKGGKEVAKSFLAALGGSGASTKDGGEGAGGGSSALDLIKQVCSDWDPLGVELNLNGDTLSVKRTDPKTAKPLDTSRIQRNSMAWVDYDSNTPNVNGTAKDQYLIGRFGEVPMDTEVADDNVAQVLQVAQRGHNHTIDLKCILSKDFVVGKWVNLTIPEMGIINRPYYISKSGYQEERLNTITLESAPPSIYVDVQEVAEEEEEVEDADAETEEEE